MIVESAQGILETTDFYFFDCDDTLYDYDFRKRLPVLSETTGLSQYHLASTWWAGGHERAAEAGEFATSEEYLDAFHQMTGAKLSLLQWQHARAAAMTVIDGSICALRWAAANGTTSLLSNNPIPFHDCLSDLAPQAHELLHGNDLVSAQLCARKPGREVYRRALKKLGAEANDAILIDDSAANAQSAIDVGMHGSQITKLNGHYDTDAVHSALTAFSARTR